MIEVIVFEVFEIFERQKFSKISVSKFGFLKIQLVVDNTSMPLHHQQLKQLVLT